VIEGSGGEGLDEAAMRSEENINLGDEFEINAGAQQVFARMSQNSPNTILAALPFASLAWRGDNTRVSYRMASAPSGANEEESEASYYLPQVSMRNGELVLQHGMHQEINWERRTDASGVSFLVYSDQIENPVLEARGQASANDGVLLDPVSRLMRGAGQNYSSNGVMATVERRVTGGNRLSVTYANGNALVMPAFRPATLGQLFGAARPHRAQMYAISLSGTLEGTGTKWRASYRWQPADTITAIAPFEVGAVRPYLNLNIRQPICIKRDGVNIEALLNVNNLLEEGYQPYVVNGGVVVFAQAQRSMGAGLAFTF
jgi:hypothetical protein